MTTTAAAIMPAEQKSGITGLAKPAIAPAQPPLSATSRIIATVILLVVYYATRESLVAGIITWASQSWGLTLKAQAVNVPLVAALLGVLAAVWWRILVSSKAFHAPVLITCILLMADAGFGVLENHASPLLAWLTAGRVDSYTPTLAAIATTVLTELTLGYFLFGKMPPLVSAYVSGISAGILIKSPQLWPFILCGMISITSKYVLRLGNRHLWNPTNFGVSMMLFLAPATVASLTIQAGNEIWGPALIWVLGGLILANLGLFHISITFVVSFLVLSWLRTFITGDRFLTEVAPITSPMFQLYIFFMITDPKTIVKGWRWQVLVAFLVAVAETVYRLAFRDAHSLYHALFTVGPIANIIEIIMSRPPEPAKAQATSAPAPA